MIHELALSMGSDDPTKPDYSKYQKKLKKEGFWSNVMPLLHGRLSNIDYFWYVSKGSGERNTCCVMWCCGAVWCCMLIQMFLLLLSPSFFLLLPQVPLAICERA